MQNCNRMFSNKKFSQPNVCKKKLLMQIPAVNVLPSWYERLEQNDSQYDDGK